ncbi:MAG: ATP-dependent Clp protease ATP-binding subunit [Acidobacteria bacterium]|nr:ATP-dependent Clp protease ATP-binding subunit [Acidobacteriota bacterium]
MNSIALRLGDNNTVNFERTMIFMTSNLGAAEMMRVLRPEFGFEALAGSRTEALPALEKIGMQAVRKKFPPEFVNRLDLVLTYRPLDRESMEAILEQQLAALQAHINQRLAARAFPVEITDAAREFLLAKGTSVQFGARELKRTIHRQLIQPISAMVANGLVEPGEPVVADAGEDPDRLVLTTDPALRPRRPRAA